MRTLCLLMFLGIVTCCGAPGQKTTLVSSAPAGKHSTEPAAGGSSSSRRAPEVREREGPRHAGHGPPRVFIHNSYLTTQYVFLDSQSIASVPPASERNFEVPVGAHSISLSDTANGQNNRQYIAEVFDAGFEYRYEVLAR